MTARPGISIEWVQPARLDRAARERHRVWRLENPELRAPTLSLGYGAILQAARGDVQIACLSRAGAPIGHAVFHKSGRRLSAAGSLIADRQGLVGSPREKVPLDALAEAAGAGRLQVQNWLAGAEEKAPQGLAAHASHLIDLSAGLDSYRAERHASAREHLKKLARRRRALEEMHGPVRLVWPDRDPAALAELLAWKQAQFRRTGRHDILSSSWVQRFIAELVVSRDPECLGELATLRVGDRVIAAELGLAGLGVYQSWLAAYDPGFAKAAPGHLLLQAIIEAAPARSIVEIDLGAGHDDYKRYFANRTRPVWSGALAGLSFSGRAAAVARQAAFWAEARFGGGIAALPARIMRRADVVLACERNWIDRAAGLAAAVRRPVEG